ncbi:MAG: aldose 1-epimerase [Burkholderiaceae bacterium]
MMQALQLHSGAAQVRLLPQAGGRISSLRLARAGAQALDILHPYPEDFFGPIRWAKGGIYPLMPYSNRIADAHLEVDGQSIALPTHPDAAPHTLHGNAHAQAWQLEQANASSALMTLDSPSCAAWPWHYKASLRVQLTPDQLALHIALTNVDTRSMPAGIGLHPYFRHRPDGRLAYRAGCVWPPTAEFLPGDRRAPLPNEDYTAARPLPEGGLTQYVGDWKGEALIDLPEGACLKLSADPVFSHLVVHRPDSIGYLCLEPVSHVADAFNLAARGVPDTGAQQLAPGETMTGTIRLQLQGDVE